ncbi:MAG TPA: response regulator transcription factor [Actinomadura sp.]|jgi:DNA-binding response OmpR family regulator|nr:response regulator transcription factor [Actinomadura sp.]
MGDGGGLVLVIEHDPGVAELQRLYLAREGFTVRVENDPERAPETAARIRPDVVVLDLSVPGLAPAPLYRRVAEMAHPATVICVLGPGTMGSVSGAVSKTRVPKCADAPRRAARDAAAAGRPCESGPGPDDQGLGEWILTRPFSPRLLVAAVGGALRRFEAGEPAGLLRIGGLTLDPETRSAGVGDRHAVLTATEFDLLAFFVRNQGRVFTREQLLDAVWSPGASAGARTVDVHIAQLRAKLGEDSPIRTVRGVGYAAGT